MYRREFYELPPNAIREAIANAVTHRNYMDSACIQVCIFDDRIEIISPGILFGGLTIEMIKKGRSRIRNAGIAEVLSRMYVIEGWGTGIKRMIEECRSYGVREPVFTELGTDFRVSFYRNQPFLCRLDNVTVNDTVNVTEELMAKYPELELILNNPSLTTTEMAIRLNYSRRTVSRHIKALKDAGILVREGSDKDDKSVITSSSYK